MKKVIKIKYDSENKKAYIYYENEFVDSSVIEGKEISQWVYPFIIKNKRWNGIYEEMKELCQNDEFIVIFIGNDSDFEILNDALKDTKAELLKINNKVIILHNDEDNSVNITINDKEFDTSRIDNIPIDEWVLPFETDDIKWKGIYPEIVSYLGINSYSVQFTGNQKHMNILMDNCPENVDITFKPYVIEENSAVTEKKGGKTDSLALKNNSFANKTAGGNNMFAPKGNNVKGMSSLNNNMAPKSAAKGMSSLNSGSVKSTAKGMSSLNGTSASKGTVSSMKSNTAQKSPAKDKPSSNGVSAAKNSDNLMSSIKNTPSARNNINPDESKLSVPEAGWEDTSTGLIKELKTEIKNLREYNSMLSIVGLVLCIVSAAGILLSLLLMSSVVAIISAIPALVFAVWAFIEDYKKIAVTVIILDVLLAVIVCLVVFIRWRILWNSYSWRFW